MEQVSDQVEQVSDQVEQISDQVEQVSDQVEQVSDQVFNQENGGTVHCSARADKTCPGALISTEIPGEIISWEDCYNKCENEPGCTAFLTILWEMTDNNLWLSAESFICYLYPECTGELDALIPNDPHFNHANGYYSTVYHMADCHMITEVVFSRLTYF